MLTRARDSSARGQIALDTLLAYCLYSSLTANWLRRLSITLNIAAKLSFAYLIVAASIVVTRCV